MGKGHVFCPSVLETHARTGIQHDKCQPLVMFWQDKELDIWQQKTLTNQVKMLYYWASKSFIQ